MGLPGLVTAVVRHRVGVVSCLRTDTSTYADLVVDVLFNVDPVVVALY
jgi:hypothetical protein